MRLRDRRAPEVLALLLALLSAIILVRALAARADGRIAMRRLVTRRFNPVVTRLGLVGGRRSPWASLEHVGRRSGTVYRTPVFPLVSGDHVFIPLPYGTDVQWARNVRAAGHCRLQRHEAVLDLDEPAVVGAGEIPFLPSWYRQVIERRGTKYLRLHVLHAHAGHLGDPEEDLAGGSVVGTPHGPGTQPEA